MIRRLGQFTDNYGDPFVTIYRDFFNPGVVNFTDRRLTTRMYKHSKQILLKPKSRYGFAFYTVAVADLGKGPGGPAPPYF